MVGAIFRQERSAQWDVVVAIVRACGGSDAEVASWARAWLRFGKPYQNEQRRCRREGYNRKVYAQWADQWG